MNRNQRRNMVKTAIKNGVKKEHAKAYAEISKGTGFHTPAKHFQIGDKVKLDIDVIKARKNYNVMNPKYKEFVESSKGMVLTVQKENSNLICLEEEPKWLFWSGDLITVLVQEAENA